MMPSTARLALLAAVTVAVIGGCSEDTSGGSPESSESAVNGSTSALERAAALAVARGASAALLAAKPEDGGAGLTASAAQAIAFHHDTLATISDLEALPSVGPATIRDLGLFARGQRVAGAMTLGELLAYEAPQTFEAVCSGKGRIQVTWDDPGVITSGWATWTLSAKLGNNDAVELSFAEGQGLAFATNEEELELVLSTVEVQNHSDRDRLPPGLAFPGVPPLTAKTRLAPATIALSFTKPSFFDEVTKHSGDLGIDVVDGKFSFRANLRTTRDNDWMEFRCSTVR